MRLRGEVKVEAVERSLGEIVRRHEVLRTRFVEEGGKPYQRIEKAEEVRVASIDVSGIEEREEVAREIIRQEAGRGFELSKDRMMRVKLIKLGADDHVLMITMHHIVADGWSVGIFIREFKKLYEAYDRGEEAGLEELAIQYADYSQWQRSWLQGEVLEQQLAYWRGELEGAPVLELATDRPRLNAGSYRGGLIPFSLSSEITGKLRAISKQESATLFMTLLAAFQCLLGRYTGQNDVSIGTDIAGRNRKETENLIGLFVNQLVLRSQFKYGWNFREMLRHVRNKTLAAYAHQEVPFEKLVEELAPERDLSRTPLFQTMLLLQNTPSEELHLAGLQMSGLGSQLPLAKFELTLTLKESGEGLFGELEYASNLFDAVTVTQLLNHYSQFLESIVDSPDERLATRSLMSPTEREQILSLSTGTWIEYPEHFVHELFEEQAQSKPDSIAVTSGDRAMSYGELNRRANLVASHLRRLGVGPEVRVGLYVERSEEMVAGLMGVLKAGGAYVPLEVRSPVERLAYMLDDAGVAVVLTGRKLVERVSRYKVKVVCLDGDAQEIATEESRDTDVKVEEENLAYVIYTSGSTGQPKAVAVTHGGLSNYLLWARSHYDTRRGAPVHSPLSFDLTVSSLLVPLVAGSSVSLIDDTQAMDELAEAISQHSLIKLTPSHMVALRQMKGEMRVSGYPTFVIGGEALSWEEVKQWEGAARLINEYGPTETVVGCCVYEATGVEGRGGVPIGRPIANTRAYVVDEAGEAAAVGVGGELYIGGAGVARGYLNKAGQTAEKFVPDAFGEERGGRLYRTGDRARWMQGGELQYLGRRDEQVKVRGYRIELGEIEAVMMQQAGVAQCAVMVREGRLVAYVSGAEGQEVRAGELREEIGRKLPVYMMPGEIVVMGRLPLTRHGKVDRRALPEPQREGGAERRKGASSAVEEIVVGIWGEVLGREEVGVEENFFELGGHSLLATQVISRIRAAFGVELPLRTLFEHATVKEFAASLNVAQRDDLLLKAPPIVPVSRDKSLPLSFAQQRLWFLHKLNPEGMAYNCPVGLRLRGALNYEALLRSLVEIQRRHEVLRTCFPEYNGQPVQRIITSPYITLPLVDISICDEGEQLALRLAQEEFARPFNLGDGPLMRAALLRLNAEDHVLLLTMHHIVADGWSSAILYDEMIDLYSAFAAGQFPALAELPIQYADFAYWQRSWLDSQVLDKQLNYWQKQLEGSAELDLPLDRLRPAIPSHRGGNIPIRIPAEVGAQCKVFSRREGATSFMMLLASFELLLARYSGQNDIAIGTSIANRNRLETEGLIGFFVNQLVLRAHIDPALSFRQLLRQVRDMTLEAYAHQDVPFEKIVEVLAPERNLSRQPLYQVLFALQNTQQHRHTARATDLSVEAVDGELEIAKVDLTILLNENASGFGGTVVYATDLFCVSTIERLLQHWSNLLTQIASHPDLNLSAYSLLSDPERHQLLSSWSCGPQPSPAPHTLDLLFTSQAAASPCSIALAHNDLQLSYYELNCRSNMLAHFLRSLGVGPGLAVAICLERGMDQMIAVLGVLKAGACYVPVDPAYPAERVSFLLEDCQAPVLIVSESLRQSLPTGLMLTVSLESDWEQIQQHSRQQPESLVDGDELAYIIYTSGSTGKPKGVGISHRSASNLARAQMEAFGIREGTVVMQFASMSFDAAVSEWTTALLTGGRLVMGSGEEMMPGREMIEMMRREGVEVVTLPPSVLGVLPEDELPSLTTLVVAGEACPQELVGRWGSSRRMLNAYGPTETTVCATVSGRLEEGSAPLIGKAIRGMRVYVLDERQEPLPQGVAGELCVGGVGVARGYLNKAGQTAEKFVPDAFGEERGGRLYRTGDRARWMQGGELQYLGRRDEQVKVRGYRVELGEVEAVMMQQAGVAQCAVIVRDDALVAYVVPHRWASPPDADSLVLPNGMAVAYQNRNETDFMFQEIFDRQSYLRHGIQLFEDGCVFDVGANIGLFTLFASERCPKGRIYAFEPITPIFENLRSNAAQCAAPVKLFPIALGEQEGFKEFTYFPRFSGMSGLSDYADTGEGLRVVKNLLANEQRLGSAEAAVLLGEADEVLGTRFESTKMQCRVRTLSDVIREENVSRIDLLKIDVERAEMDVLLGIRPEDLPRISQIVMEVHDRAGQAGESRLRTIVSYLQAHGFDVAAEQDELFEGTELYNVYARRRDQEFAAGRNRIAAPSAQPVAVSEADLREQMRCLPDYMVPSRFVLLRSLPLTPNGKIDRKALPQPGSERSTGLLRPRDSMETLLKHLWEEALGVDDLDIRHDFFQRGGHSLRAVSLSARLAKVFGAQIPVRAIFERPTVEKMAAYLRQEVTLAPPSSVVPVQSGGTRRPLFCVHPGGGLVHAFVSLARSLGPQQPLYGLQSHGLEEGQSPITTIEEMAALYINDLRAVQPEGPYQLAGLSMGAVVAYEMAQQMTAGGEHVSFLGLLDGTYSQKPADFFAEGWEQSIEDWISDYILRKAESDLAIPAEEMKRLDQEAQLARYVESAKAADHIPADITIAQFHRFLRVMATNIRALDSYRPKPYRGNITLFRTDVPDESDETLGWGRLALGRLDIHAFMGVHGIFMSEQHLEQFAALLTQCLNLSE